MNKIIHPMEPEELMAYLDGEVPSERAEIAAAHLSECAGCREVVAGLRRVSQGMGVWEVATDVRPSPALAAELEERGSMQQRILVSRRGWRTALRRYWKPAAWVGAFAAIALVAVINDFGTRKRPLSVFYDSVELRADEKTGAQDHPSDHSLSTTNARSYQQPAGIVGGIDKNLSAEIAAPPPPPTASKGFVRGEGNAPGTTAGAMIIRTAQVSLITKDFDNARASMEAILKRHRGYVADLKIGGATGSGRTLTATLRVPADRLDASLIELKTLGRLDSESQSGQDVTSQYVDLQARLANSRNTEQRLTDLLRNRTGKLSDVLEVEQEVDRVRGEIEQMEAERKNMSNQVSYATLNVAIAEDYKAQLQVVPPSTWTRLSNASVEGYKSMVEGVMSLVLFLLENGPSLLLWIAILFLPARLVWKKVRRSFAH
jgi:anti-sigma factor RsiW